MSRTVRPRRQRAMTQQTPLTPVSQEAAVAALQATTTHLNERVGDLARATEAGMANIAHKLDEIQKQAQQIAAIAASQREASTAIERAFGEIRATNTRLDLLATQQIDIEKKAATARGGLIVLSGVAALVMAIVGWALNPVIQTASANAREIVQLQIELARIKKGN